VVVVSTAFNLSTFLLTSSGRVAPWAAPGRTRRERRGWLWMTRSCGWLGGQFPHRPKAGRRRVVVTWRPRASSRT